MSPDGLRLIEQRERLEAAKFKVLQDAADRGWADLAAGRCTDLADDQLADVIGQLGQLAAGRAQTTG